MISINMRQLLEAGVHFGHKARYWNPKMTPFIFGTRQKIHIINLEETLPRFRDALNYLGRVAANRGKVLFVGTKPAAREIIKEEAIRSGMPYVNHRWLGGMLTNYKTIRKSIKRLKELEQKLDSENALDGMTKKELLNLMREKDKLAACIDGIKNMGGLPDVLFVIDVNNEKIAIQEAK
nr:30S ribosomal protein S2 [Gammaproteobacteria bacterium]